MTEYKLVAPDIDRLIRHFDRGFQNAEPPSKDLMAAMEPLFSALSDLAPCKANDEAKIIWITVPRGDITDYGSFEEAKEYEEVETYEEFVEQWKSDYPEDVKWYRVTIGQSKPEARFQFKSLAIDNTGIISADLSTDPLEENPWHRDDAAIKLCELILPAAQKSMEMLRDGTYNNYVEKNLPYEHRTGVILRSDEWKVAPDVKDYVWENMDDVTFQAFKVYLASNSKDEIERFTTFTANTFFRACVMGYKAIGYALEDLTPVQAYLRYADGRDDGLTGTGHGLNEGPGIDPDDPSAWDKWYNGPRGGGHPWEVVRGGNSTHVELYVMNDKEELRYQLRSGKIDQAEYVERMEKAGYYFAIAGKHRAFESVSFFVALRDAGWPVYLYDSDEILARYEGTDYVGIVPHRIIPKYCEGMFPKEEYGRVIDFMHVYDEDKELLQYVTWLPEEPAELKQDK